MKRDARIGLAVVLVLGLLVTLLVGRVVYKHTGNDDGDLAAAGDGAAPVSGDIRRVDAVDSTAVAQQTAAAAAQPQMVSNNPPAAHNTNPAVQRLIDDQTRSMATEPALSLPAPSNGPVATSVTAAKPQGNVKGDLTADLDHESSGLAAMSKPATVDAPAPEMLAYTVVAGDNIWKISSKVYGDGKYTQRILEANPGAKAQKLHAGQILKIPAIPNKTILLKLAPYSDAAKTAKKPEVVAAASTGGAATLSAVEDKPAEAVTTAKGGATHKVEAGETLSSIAKKYYGSSGPKAIQKIVAANQGLDVSKLHVGQEISIPGAN